MVHVEVKRHFVLPVGGVIYKGVGDAFDERVIFLWLFGMAVDILPGDAKGCRTDGFDDTSGNQLNFFSLSSWSM